MTDPLVGASTCASGSQIWNGNMGILIEKAIKPKIHNKHSFSNGIKVPYRINNFVLCDSKKSIKIQKNKKTDPIKVYKKK